jgi:glucose-1-phosphate thymidylyltransferase
MKALIAAAGSGTRLRPLTFSTNKQLLKVVNKPLLLYPFEALVETGIKEFGIIVNETRPAVEELLGDGSKWGVKITYINQPKPLGLAHVVKIARDFLANDRFVYILGDNIFTKGILPAFEHFEKTQADALLTVVKHKENYRLGVPIFDEAGKLTQVVEKPENPPNEFGVPGLYMFGPKVFEAYDDADDGIKPSGRGELEITDLYSYLLRHNRKVEVHELKGRWFDPGKFDDMITTHHFLLDDLEADGEKADVDDLSVISGVMVAEKDVKIIQSRIVGPSHIGEGTIIKNSTIGPYVTIGANCRIENVVITNSVVYDNAVIENVDEVIIDSLIGKHSHIWQAKHQSTSLFIGDHCSVRLT